MLTKRSHILVLFWNALKAWPKGFFATLQKRSRRELQEPSLMLQVSNPCSLSPIAAASSSSASIIFVCSAALPPPLVAVNVRVFVQPSSSFAFFVIQVCSAFTIRVHSPFTVRVHSPFTIRVYSPFTVRVRVRLEATNAIDSSLFKKWLHNLQSEIGILADGTLALRQVLIQGVDMFGKCIGFLKFKADIYKPVYVSIFLDLLLLTLCSQASIIPLLLVISVHLHLMLISLFIYNKVNRDSVPGIVFARGPAMTMLILLESDGETYAILTKQVLRSRVPTGRIILELPAGMTAPEELAKASIGMDNLNA
ncbi:hypothetical protein Ahy_B03g065113 [Arachis hypogaea]|uniref:Uncharacterized protein n=1 Tax=Arachis hypogaea TaxID=3818 RepID=A0A445A0S6_ARAHY|nr:hypothetical protein Ahy_B03g065113 [Arachis hypogaea]